MEVHGILAGKLGMELELKKTALLHEVNSGGGNCSVHNFCL